jgi:CheY-like chemotaxis protein
LVRRQPRAPFSARFRTSRGADTLRSLSKPATILVCDDEAVLRALVRASLDDHGYAIVEARDGDQALELARAERPDLIVIDMMMPGRSGTEVVAEIRADEELRTTPIVMLTARAQVTDRAAALAAGVDRFLAKPFSPLELAETIEELLAV